MAVEDTLQQVELFSEMTRKDLNRLAKVTVKRDYKKGDVIVREGDLGIAFYVVAQGHVEIVRALGSKDEHVVYTHGPGGFFGEMALIDGGERVATVTATSAMQLLVLDRHDFNEMLELAMPQIAPKLLAVVGARVRAIEERTGVESTLGL
jgi:CRP-like cAMP-binding protein